MAVLRQREDAPSWRSELEVAWRALKPHAVPLLALAALAVALYYPTLGWIGNAWLHNEYYGHGFLVIPVAVFFAWRARSRVYAAAADPSRSTNLWGVGLAGLVFAVGFARHDPFLLALSLVLFIAGSAIYILGLRKASPLLLPIAFLLFAVPIPNLLAIGFALQELAVRGTTALLAVFQMDFRQDNFTIIAGTLRFEVAPMCSGLSSAISILMLATTLAWVSPLKPLSRAVVIGAAIPVALAANVLRIVLTIVIGVKWGPEASQGFFHGASSLVLFLIALGAVWGLTLALGALERRQVLARH